MTFDAIVKHVFVHLDTQVRSEEPNNTNNTTRLLAYTLH